VEFATFTQTVMIRTVLLNTAEVHQTSSKAGSGINILYLLTGPILVCSLLSPFWRLRFSPLFRSRRNALS